MWKNLKVTYYMTLDVMPNSQSALQAKTWWFEGVI